MDATVQGVKFVFANNYATNKVAEQCVCLREPQDMLDSQVSNPRQKLIIRVTSVLLLFKT